MTRALGIVTVASGLLVAVTLAMVLLDIVVSLLVPGWLKWRIRLVQTGGHVKPTLLVLL